MRRSDRGLERRFSRAAIPQVPEQTIGRHEAVIAPSLGENRFGRETVDRLFEMAGLRGGERHGSDVSSQAVSSERRPDS